MGGGTRGESESAPTAPAATPAEGGILGVLILHYHALVVLEVLELNIEVRG